MLGNKIKDKLPVWDNETIRYFFVLRSAAFRESVAIIWSKYQLTGLASKTIKKKLVSFGTKTPLDTDVDAVSDHFSVQRHFVEAVLSQRTLKDLDVLLGYSIPIYHAPITDTGAYIKVSPLTSKKMVLRAYESIKDDLKQWETNTEKGTLTPSIRDRSTKPQNVVKLSELFVTIENMIFDNYQYEKEHSNREEQVPSTMNQVYEEAGKVAGFPQKKSESKTTYVARIRNIYLVDVLKYYSLPRFSESKELFITIKL